MGSKSEERQKDRWDKFQILAQASLALVALAFTVMLGLYQQKNADATLEVARSNCELARTQVKSSLLPQLSSEDAKVRSLTLSLAVALDKQFAAEIASAYAINDVNEGVRQKARVVLGDLAQSDQDAVKQRALKSANQYDLVDELRTSGLSKKLQEARAYVEAGSPNGIEEALSRYHNVLKHLTPGALDKLDRGLLMDAQNDEKGGHKELAARKYRSLFQDYGG